jgi:hypothetical protein
MVDIKIKGGVKMPKRYKWPFSKLEVGKHFIAGPFSNELQRNMVSIANYYTKKLGYKFSTRKIGKQLGVWRVS